jgi:hypothetical protein
MQQSDAYRFHDVHVARLSLPPSLHPIDRVFYRGSYQAHRAVSCRCRRGRGFKTTSAALDDYSSQENVTDCSGFEPAPVMRAVARTNAYAVQRGLSEPKSRSVEDRASSKADPASRRPVSANTGYDRASTPDRAPTAVGCQTSVQALSGTRRCDHDRVAPRNPHRPVGAARVGGRARPPSSRVARADRPAEERSRFRRSWIPALAAPRAL